MSILRRILPLVLLPFLMALSNAGRTASVFLVSAGSPAMESAVQGHQTSALEASEIPPDALRYTVIFFSKPIGIEGVWKAGNREWRYHYEFNDRGHGPWVDEKVALDALGLPVSLSVEGHDEDEEAVADHFSVTGNKRTWQNNIEKGASEQSGFYLSAPVVHEEIAAVPEELATLCRALLHSSRGSLRILPTGEAQIRQVGEVQVQTEGQQKTVRAYDVSGLDFEPVSVWLESNGTTFAILGDLTLIQKGWESTLPVLNAFHEHAARERDGKLAQQLSHQPRGAFAYRHVNLFDAETATVKPDATVVVSGPRILAVGSEGQVQIPSGAEVMDAQGKTLIPGLWDMHVHIEGVEGLMSLAVGVTTARDLGNNVEDEVAMRKDFDSGRRIGPRVLLAGLIDGRGDFQSSLGIAVGSEKEAEQAVLKYADLKFDQIKVYSSVPPEYVPKIVALAHAHGMRVSGHVPMHMLAQDVVHDGFDEIQHIYYMFLNFMPDVMNRDAPKGLVSAVADRAATIDLDSEQVRSFLRLLREHGTVIDPTLNAFESLFTARLGVPEPSLAPVLGELPLKMRRSALMGGVGVPQGKDQRYRDSFQACLKMTQMLHEAGIPLVVGTDFLAGFTYQRELELHVAAGIPAQTVLQYATLGSARIMKRDAELGSITPGKLADMVLIDGNPVRNISEIRRVLAVMKNGVVYSAPALLRSIGVQPRTTAQSN